MALSLLVLLAILSSGCAIPAPSVTLGRTTVVGRAIPEFQQEFFGGLPYALPPIGPRRLSPPVLTTQLNVETFDASEYGFSCVQLPQEQGVPLENMSEDCLTINILRPADLPRNALLPVMFWTYGGGFVGGNSSVYNASVVVAQSVARGTPVVYVNFNYRLGALGFPVGADAARAGSLNLGMKDQLTALKWVHANIGAFGGDKTKVTIFGESAGSMMTSVLFFNPDLEMFVRAAILESGLAATMGLYPPTRNQGSWDSFIAAIPECASLPARQLFSCVKNNASTSSILTATATVKAASLDAYQWMPVVDGDIIPDLPSKLLAAGRFAKIPFIAGTNLDEATGFDLIYPSYVVDSTDALKELLFQSVFRTSANPAALPSVALQRGVDELLKLYPDIPALGSPFGTGNATFGKSTTFKRAAALLTDMWFVSLRRQAMDAATAHGLQPYGYLFTQPQPEVPAAYGVAHGLEVPSVYGAPFDTSDSSVALSKIMVDYWLSFATSLTPNDGCGAPNGNRTPYTTRPVSRVPHSLTLNAIVQAVIQLNGANLTMIPDNFRSEQTMYMAANSALWGH
ncbi:Carboxylic ester hydrolase [Mycena indigotica]|uniref:Carboxylic ester hydrolase n=1 Tax=Mycena indigotica TaxID=2126181 RepID=A0A8H6VSC0_9AGAR|nr:Carboxylic ester hydrolase [Mycena indigotica]KAF7290221.1 Carboxylic ester hydrolase [Mycena indigotica]